MSTKEKLLIDFLDLMYDGKPEFYHYSYYDNFQSNESPRKILKINNFPIFEVTSKPVNVVSKLLLFETKYELNLSDVFTENIINFFGDVPNLKEIVFTWVLRKELNEYDIYNL